MSLLLLLALLSARPSSALDIDPPEATAGQHLRAVWSVARERYPDARLISISGAVPSDGKARCSPDSPFQNGWRYTFYSPSADEFVMMAACQGQTAGPLRQLRSHGEEVGKLTVSGKFIDSDEALRTLGRAGVDLAQVQSKLPGKRPFSMELSRLDDGRFKDHPPVWRVRAGQANWAVDAVHDEKFDPTRYGLDYSVQLASAIANSETLAERPKHGDVYTAKTDMQKALAYARDHYPEASFMGLEGFVDAWGGSPCTGPGDGWAFYFYNPRRGDFDAVYSCNGYVGPGPIHNIPVNVGVHETVTVPYVDSDEVVNSLLVTHGDAFNETMGRRFNRTGSLVLRQYKSPPFDDPALWKVRALWELTIGRTQFRFDAVNGRLLDVR